MFGSTLARITLLSSATNGVQVTTAFRMFSKTKNMNEVNIIAAILIFQFLFGRLTIKVKSCVHSFARADERTDDGAAFT